MNQEQSPRMSVPSNGTRLTYSCYLLPPEFDPEQLNIEENRQQIDLIVSDSLNVNGLTSHLYEIAPNMWLLLFFHAGADRKIRTYDRIKLEPGVQIVTPRSVACVYFSWRSQLMYVHLPAKAEPSIFFTALWPLFPGRRRTQAFERITFNASRMGDMPLSFRRPDSEKPAPWKYIALRMAEYGLPGEQGNTVRPKWKRDGFEDAPYMPPYAWRRMLDFSIDVRHEGRGRAMRIRIMPQDNLISATIDSRVVHVLDVLVTNMLGINHLLTQVWGCAE